MALTYTHPSNLINPTQGSCPLCLCFFESAIMVATPVAFTHQLTFGSNPSAAESIILTIYGIPYEFVFVSGSPTTYLEVQIGALATNTRDNFITVLEAMSEFDPAFYLISASGAVDVVITAVLTGANFNVGVDLSNIASVTTVSSTAGVSWELKEDYHVKYHFLFDGVVRIPSTGNFIMRPLIKRNYHTDDFTTEMCEDVSGILKNLVRTPPLTFYPNPIEIPEIIGEVSIRYSEIVAGVPPVGGFRQTDPFKILNGWCEEAGNDADLYMPDDEVLSWDWMVTAPLENRKYCANKKKGFYVVLPEGTWDFEVRIDGDHVVAEDFQLVVTGSPTSAEVYYIPGPESAGVTPVNEATITISATEAFSALYLNDLVYTTVGDYKSLRCCPSELMFFLNWLGVWEPFQVGSTREIGLSVDAEKILNKDTCSSVIKNRTVSGKFEHVNTSYTWKYRQTEEWIKIIRKFLTSPEHYIDLNGVATRIEIVGWEEAIVTAEDMISVTFDWVFSDKSTNLHINHVRAYLPENA